MGEIKYINSTKPEVELPSYSGQRYEIMMPDTLDLQDMACRGVNGLTGPTDPEADYEIYWRAAFSANREPIMWHSDVGDIGTLGEFIEALPLLRVISGSSRNDHVEQRWLEVIRQMQGPDGLLHIPKIGRPWCVWNYSDSAPLCLGREPTGNHYVSPFFGGRSLGTMTIYSLLTGDTEWKNAGRKLADGLGTLAVAEGEKAHLPLTGEPVVVSDNTAALSHSWCIQGLANHARHTGYEPALDLAGRFAHWVIEDLHYFGSDGRFLQEYPGNPRVHFYGHTSVLSSLLDYGIISGDKEAVDFAHRGFRYGMTRGECLLGYFPEWLDVPFAAPLETCELAQMIALALKLSRHGVGDYWDMVERWVRNLFFEAQLKKPDRFRWVTGRIPATEVAPMELPPYHTAERVVERNIGAFGSTLAVNDLLAGRNVYGGSYLDGIAHCCTGNATRTIYYVWENIITHDAGKLRVNLALNRGSRWVDVNSHLPYRGQIDIQVKESVELSVRIPEWVKPEETKCTVDARDRRPEHDGRYAVVGKVKAGESVTLSFPITERSEYINVEKRAYRVLLRGNTCVDIDPPGVNVPLFQREHYREDETRWRKRTRFIPEQQIDW